MAKLILIADDARESRKLMRLFLERENYKVIEVSNGEDAMREIEKNKPDLLILDLVMPVMDGMCVALELGKKPETSSIPIIISTSHGKLVNLLTLGASTCVKDSIDKPFKPEELVKKVNRILS
jgi:DNA-binding response OmpR family regulator